MGVVGIFKESTHRAEVSHDNYFLIPKFLKNVYLHNVSKMINRPYCLRVRTRSKVACNYMDQLVTDVEYSPGDATS
jgi:hypothetical protein